MKKQYDILDEAIRLTYLESDSLNEAHTDQILNENFQTKMSDKQKNRMLTKLKQKHIVSTLGVLISQKVENEEWQFSALSERAHIPLDILKKLASDEILVSGIPVRFIKNLFDTLNIPFSEAKQAILKTFEFFNQEISNQNSIAKPAFRKKKNRGVGIPVSSFRSSKNKISSLSEEKTNKYLMHLEELFQTD